MTVIPPVLVPAVIGGIAWLVAFRLWNRAAPAEHGHWGGALAFGAGFLAGYVLLLSWPSLPPTAADQWLAVLALPMAGAMALERWWGGKTWIALPIRFIIVALVLWSLSASLIEYRWETRATFLWLSGAAVFVAVLWELPERLAQRRTGFAVPAMLWLVTVATSVALVLSGSALLGQLAAALAGILGAAVVLSAWSSRWSMGFGAIGVWMLLLTGLVWQSHFYSELHIAPALCLLAAPAIGWIGELPQLREGKTWKREAARFVAVAIPLAVALLLAYRYWASVQGQEDYYY